LSPSNRTALSVPKEANLIEESGPFKGDPLPREGRIALARNIVMDFLADSSIETDFVINLDLDVVGWDLGGLLDSFGRTDWDVMCAHGIMLHGVYRDTYAFRMPGMDTNPNRRKDLSIPNRNNAGEVYFLLKCQNDSAKRRF
jgi:hypothetical protein